MDKKVATVVKCPQCGKPVPWIKSHKFKPFCSERCKLIDFGEWATGENAIPGDPLNPGLLDSDPDNKE